MSALPSYFTDFLSEIRPTDDQRAAYQAAHKRLRDQLAEDEDTKSLLISTFLQGSYRRATAVRPEGKHRPDVDVIYDLILKLLSLQGLAIANKRGHWQPCVIEDCC